MFRFLYLLLPVNLRGKDRAPVDHQAAEDGSLFVKSVIRSQLAYSPVDEDIPGWPCDGVKFSATTDATILAAEDAEGEEVTSTYEAGWHPIAARRVIAAPGADVVLGWHRKRPPA